MEEEILEQIMYEEYFASLEEYVTELPSSYDSCGENEDVSEKERN